MPESLPPTTKASVVIVPPRVQAARSRAAATGFSLSSDDGVGALLATLAAAVPRAGTIVELGTGAGVGLAWIVHGLGARTDVSVHSIDTDGELLARTAAAGWPDYVGFVEGDGAKAVTDLAPIDLVFADAPGGKVDGLEQTIGSLRRGGILVVDDMDLALHQHDGLLEAIGRVRTTLFTHHDLVSAELDYSTGVMICARRQE
jgi:demethylmenaquinone methyltransferase/2-methoxy-6-polyprenyl-1,4-benzoquinol methylase